MLKHVVAWKIKDHAEGNTREENICIIRERLFNLKTIIPQIQSMEFGINLSKDENSYDAILQIDFANTEDLEIYQVHPAHKEVSNFVSKVRTDRFLFDYEY